MASAEWSEQQAQGAVLAACWERRQRRSETQGNDCIYHFGDERICRDCTHNRLRKRAQ